MKKVFVADMTLGEAGKFLPLVPGFKEKLEAARALDKLGADVIEFCALEDAKTDSLLIRTVCSFVKNSAVSLSVGTTENGVAEAWAAVSQAQKPRLSVVLPVSPALMEYNCRLKPAAMLELIKKLVSESAALCKDVEFRAADAVRAEPDFLATAIQAAISAGAAVITVCDNEGCSLPSETEKFIKKLYSDIPPLKKVRLGYLCEDNYGLGLSLLITAIGCGAAEVKTAAGLAKFVSPDKLAEILRQRGKSLGFTASLNQTELGRILESVARIASEKKSIIPPKPTLVDETGVLLTKKDSADTIAAYTQKLGYELDAEALDKVYEAFLRVTAKKKQVTVTELDAIIAATAADVPQTYKVVSYLVTSSNVTTPSANISLKKDGEILQGVSLGDGPVDAAFLAIEQIIGQHFELDDFQIQAVTEGREAMGSALVKIRHNAKLYAGQGISTDIVGASIRAYLSAVNRVLYEEK